MKYPHSTPSPDAAADDDARRGRSDHPAGLPGLAASGEGPGRVDEGRVGAADALSAGLPDPGETLAGPGAGPASVTPSASREEGNPAEPNGSPAGLPPVVTLPGYRVVQEISRGGQAVVFEAVQKSTGRKVALKVLREGPLSTPQERARLEREVQILAVLNHPDIVQVIDHGVTEQGAHFLVMEYISGRPLDQYLDYCRERDAEQAGERTDVLRLFLRLCEAVNAAHLRGVVHRDLKPSNVRVDENGDPHVLDFGLARTGLVSMTDESQPRAVTCSGQFLGSLPWASPEQAEGMTSKIDARSDVYSLGVILYQMLTDQFPYEVVGSMRDVLNNILTARPAPPSQVLAARAAREAKLRARQQHRVRVDRQHRRINPALEAVVLKALSKRREDRYQSAGELARDVANYLGGRPTLAAGMLPAWWRPSRKSAWAAGLAAALVLAGMLAWRVGSRRPGGATPDRGTPIDVAPPVPALNRLVNLLPLIDVNHDAWGEGHWTFRGGELVNLDRVSSQLDLPYRPPEEYDFTVEFTTRPDELYLGQTLCRAGKQFCWTTRLDGELGGFERVNGAGLLDNSNPTQTHLRGWAASVRGRHTCSIQVRAGGVSAYLDGLLVREWKTDYMDLAPVLTAGNATQLSLRLVLPAGRSGGDEVIFHRVEVTEVTGKGLVLRQPLARVASDPAAVNPVEIPGRPAPPAPVYVAPAGRVVDLLPLIDLSTNVISGEWKRDGGALSSGPAEIERLAIPYEPPVEYDLRVEFTRSVARGRAIVLLGQEARRSSWHMGGTIEVMGFELVRGKPYNDNLTTRSGAEVLNDGRRHVCVLRVRKEMTDAYLDGSWVARCATAAFDPGVHEVWDLFDFPLGLASEHSPVVFHKVDLIEVTGSGLPMPATGTEDPRLVRTLKCTAPVFSVQFSRDGRRLLSSSEPYSKQTRLWDLEGGRLRGQWASFGWASGNGGRFSPDGRRFATFENESLRIRESEGGTMLLARPDCFHAAFSRDGSKVACQSLATLTLLDGQSGRALWQVPSEGWVADTWFSPDERTVLFGKWRGGLSVREAETGRELWHGTINPPVSEAAHFSFSPDGSRIAAWGPKSRELVLIDARNGTRIAVCSHRGQIKNAAFAPDGSYLVTAATDATGLYRWEPDGTDFVSRSPVEIGAAYDLALSGDGRRALVACGDKTARLYDVQSGHVLATFGGHPQRVLCAALSPDGRLAATGCADGKVRLFHMP